jgi:hypothetical protein
MRHVVRSVEESASLVEYLKIQVDELRHALGHHLETTGPAPHARRAPRGDRARTSRA